MTAGIDYGRLLMLCFPVLLQTVAMDMAMNKVAGVVLFDERSETFESPVTEVRLVMNTERRGMSDQDIYIPFMEEFVFP